jgi:hypothetical protein
MSLAQAEKVAVAPVSAGGVQFVAAARHAELCAQLRTRRYLVAPVIPPARGRLRQAIDDAVEGALAMRGALPPAVDLDAAIEPTIRDQVFRARALGATGLALAIPRIGASPDDGVLDLGDGAVISAWLAAARRAPLLLVLDEADRAARVLAPVPLGELAGASAPPDSAPPPSGEIETAPAPDAPAMPPPPVLTMPRRGVMMKRRSRSGEAAPAELSPDEPTPRSPAADPEPPRADPAALRSVAALMAAVPPIEGVWGSPPIVSDAPSVVEIPSRTPSPPPVAELPEPEEPPAPRATRAARRVADAAEWRTHAIELDKARGPKPVATIERLFATRYMPLLGAVARGEVDNAVRGVVDAWRMNFEHSYREAFAALRVTGKRPPMVFDAPDIAARVGRLNGARAIKLLLVDAMRHDIGERVAERLHERLTGRAVCIERILLWSAIPTTTPTQLALLARGQDGLRDAEPASEPDTEIVRGRAVSTLRRERLGSREVMKLDLCEARLRNAGPAYDDRLDAIADEVTPIVVKYVETLPPRTLLFLFGDHGFRLPASADGRMTGPAAQGGVSPEEVLVPGQAWLVGGVH